MENIEISALDTKNEEGEEKILVVYIRRIGENAR